MSLSMIQSEHLINYIHIKPYHKAMATVTMNLIVAVAIFISKGLELIACQMPICLKKNVQSFA